MSTAYAEANRPFSAIPPTEADPFARKTADEFTPRNCVYVGGPAELDLSSLIGESYVQHATVRRRVLTLFTEHPVGMKDESPEAEQAYLSAGPESDAVPRRRTRMKSPKEDAYQIFKTYGEEGFTVCESLLGLVEVDIAPDGRKSYDNSKAEAVYATVVPYEFMQGGSLKEFRDYLARGAQRRIAESELPTDLRARAERLRSELLASATKAHALWAKHVRSLKGEWDRYRSEGKGKADFNDVERELFREVGEPLPEERQANANKAVVETVIEATSAPNSNDALISFLLEEREERKAQDAERDAREKQRDAEIQALRDELAAQGGQTKTAKPAARASRGG
jgi:hypothetical protein